MNEMGSNPLLAMARLASIIESSHDAVISKDLNGVITSWNRGAEELFGYKADEIIGQSVTLLIPEDRINEEPDILARISKGERVEHYETIRRRKDGTLVDVSLTVSPVVDPMGRVIGASKIARDVTGRKFAEAELQKLASIVDSSGDAIISKDLNGVITSWNKGAEMIFGYKADEVLGKSITILMPPDRINEEPGILERIRRGERVDHYETVRRHKNGRLIDISLNISPVRDLHGQIIGASKIARDITSQKEVSRARSEADTMRRIVEAQEVERRRIARDLHDHIGQQMTAMRLKIQGMVAKFEGDPAVEEEIEELRQLAEKMDWDIGFLSWELRPTDLDALGLKVALNAFVEEWSNQRGIRASFECSIEQLGGGTGRMPAEFETHLFRIVQEALNNISQHSRAETASVILRSIGGAGVSLIIEDDGVGFDRVDDGEAGLAYSGLGLVGMRERANILGGSLDIESRPGRGTTLFLRFPLPAADAALTA